MTTHAELKWKRPIDYYALKTIRLEHEIADVKADNERLRKALDVLTQKPLKKFSRFFVVFSVGVSGEYCSPQIVEAYCAEEALYPEGLEEVRGDCCQRLWDVSEYKEL
jgi:hypothetical protein